MVVRRSQLAVGLDSWVKDGERTFSSQQSPRLGEQCRLPSLHFLFYSRRWDFEKRKITLHFWGKWVSTSSTHSIAFYYELSSHPLHVWSTQAGFSTPAPAPVNHFLIQPTLLHFLLSIDPLTTARKLPPVRPNKWTHVSYKLGSLWPASMATPPNSIHFNSSNLSSLPLSLPTSTYSSNYLILSIKYSSL